MKPLAAGDPRVIGEYRLRARLGAGGMGRVYLGFSPAGRAVAIKVVHRDLAGQADFLRRFRQEVSAARAVSGIYTAPVVSSGLDQDPPWLATAYVPGPALDQMVAEHGPMPGPALWALLAGLVEALRAIHGCGIVHRDLKPANVLLAADGPRVIDFGISRATGMSGLTATGMVFGTPGYMSPEQAEGKQAGPQSDVFALGCVLAYAATGAEPFGTGNAAATLYRIVHSEPDLTGIPSGLLDLVTGCLAKEPAARPELPALAAALAGRTSVTSASALSFWPRSVTSIINGYQAQETGGQDYPPGCAPSGPPPGCAPSGYPAQAPSGRPALYQPYPSSKPGPLAGPPVPYPGYPHQFGAVVRPARPVPPPSMLAAARAMYAGAANSAILTVIAYSVENHALKVKYAGAGGPPSGQLAPLGYLVVAGGLEISLWLWMAASCRRGRSWARITSSALFGIGVVSGLEYVARSHHPLPNLFAILGLLIGLTAIVLLWQGASSAYFRAAELARRL